MTNLDHLKSTLLVLNAALEHVPDSTRKILSATVQPHLTALEEALTPKPAEPPSEHA